MTKRLTAWTLALLLIVACFAFAACEEKTDNSSEAVSETSEPEVTPKTPVEILTDATKNTYSISDDWMKGDALNFNGCVVIDKSNDQKVEFNITADKNKQFTGDFGLSVKDEKAVFTLFGSDKDAFLGIDGITELPVKYSLQDQDDAKFNELIEKSKAFFAVISEVLNSDVVNDLYRTETGDITIDGIEYKNDTLVIFEINNEKIEAISEALKTKIEANADAKAFIETIKEILNKDENEEESEDAPEFDLNDVKYTLSCKTTNVIRDEKIAATEEGIKLDLEINGGKISIASNGVRNGNSEKGECSIKITVPGDPELEIPDTTVTYTMPFSADFNDKGYTFTVSEFIMEQGVKVTIPCEISLKVEYGEKSIGYALSAKMGEGYLAAPVDIELSFNISACDDPEIKLPEEFITKDKIDEEELTLKFCEKYPNIAVAFGSTIGGGGPDDYEY